MGGQENGATTKTSGGVAYFDVLNILAVVFSKKEYRKILTYLTVVGVLTVSVMPFVNAMIPQYWGFQGNGWNRELSLPMLDLPNLRILGVHI